MPPPFESHSLGEVVYKGISQIIGTHQARLLNALDLQRALRHMDPRPSTHGASLPHLRATLFDNLHFPDAYLLSFVPPSELSILDLIGPSDPIPHERLHV